MRINVMSSDGALSMEALPKSIVIVGGGVIGIEWASMLNDFGVEVTVLEYADRIIPTEDEDISKEMKKLLRKKELLCNKCESFPETLVKDEGSVTISAEINGETKEFTAEKMLVSVGRQANVEGIGIENTEIEVVNGFIKTRPTFQTKEHHIYAIGDVIGGLQLAHVASHEGIAAVEHIAGLKNDQLTIQKFHVAFIQVLKHRVSGLLKNKRKNKDLTLK